jgi:hypothetical protein
MVAHAYNPGTSALRRLYDRRTVSLRPAWAGLSYIMRSCLKQTEQKIKEGYSPWYMILRLGLGLSIMVEFGNIDDLRNVSFSFLFSFFPPSLFSFFPPFPSLPSFLDWVSQCSPRMALNS